MSKQENDAGDVIIPEKKIKLKSFDGGKELNIYNLVRSFDIYESLENYCLTANFYIAEGIELLNEFPLGGEETIEITLQTPSRDSISYKFHVESVQGVTTNDQSNLKSYKLQCVTKDYVKNASFTYSKRYKDKKYHEAINEVITVDLGGGTLKTTEQCKGKFDYVVNNVRAFQVVDLIKERAVSSENQSSVFVFYEDNKGYHFTTIEKLIKDRKGGAKGKEFSADVGQRTGDYEKVINVRNILSYETVSMGSSVDKVIRGGMRNEYREFDIWRGTYDNSTRQKYVNTSDHGGYEATDDNNDFNSAAFNAFVTEKPAVTKMLVKDGLRPEMEHNKNVHYMRPFVERITQQVVRIRVYGDTSLRVGDVIKLNIPEISGLTQEPKQNKIFSENYIVTNLKHRADQQANGDFEHFVIMDCAKPNQYGKALG